MLGPQPQALNPNLQTPNPSPLSPRILGSRVCGAVLGLPCWVQRRGKRTGVVRACRRRRGSCRYTLDPKPL